MATPSIVLFRQDLRILDNPALWHAATTGSPLILLYILDDISPGNWKMGQAQRWWLYHSLKSLQASLNTMGAQLILRKGETTQILSEIIKESKADHLYYNRGYEPYWRQIDSKIKELPVDILNFNSSLFFEPWEITNKQGKPFKVFTQFWKTCEKSLSYTEPLPKPTLNAYSEKIKSDQLEDWDLLPTHPNWAKEFSSLWTPGEEGAWQKLELFIQKASNNYDVERNVPSSSGTSLLSPHLHMGEISPKQIHWRLKNVSHTEKFLSELGWRDFSYHLLYHFPSLPEQPFQPRFASFPWKENSTLLHAWQKGMTGYPIVDAGMRQLWRTGWMHNRVRMVVASFLTKDLHLPWQKGAAWFWDTLVDADLANNSASWQWVAGCGADAAPFFRIFNPVLQGEKFDPEGTYVKKWVPELAKLPAKFVHKPWEAPADLLSMAGVTLGDHYPLPVVDHQVARLQALEYFKNLE